MFENDKRLANAKGLQRFGDLQFLGTCVFVLVLILVSWSGVKAIGNNYELQKQIAQLQQQNDIRSLENTNMELKNEYLKTDRYLELSAREHFNKGAPGEKLLLVPDSVALAHTVELPKPQTARPVTSKQSRYEQNFNAWLDFFFHRTEPS
jgi:cell division protein FtsB